jgi:hypothetical protein
VLKPYINGIAAKFERKVINMGLKEHLIEKINDALLGLKLPYEATVNVEGYIKGEIEEGEFFKNLPSIDMDNLNADVVEKMVSTYNSLDKHKASDYLSKYIKMLFQMGNVTVFSVIDKTTYYYGDEYCRKFLKYDLSPAFVIAYYARCTARKESTLDRGFIKFYDSLYEENKNQFKEALTISKTNERAIIATYLVQKEKDKELCSWLESDIIASMEVLFDNNISEMEVELLDKHLKGEASDVENIVEILRSNNKLVLGINTYVFKFLVGMCSTISNESEVANRFIKFAILFDYEKAIGGLYNYLKYNRYNKITKLMNSLQIKEELYIAWMGNYNSLRYDATFEKELKEELEKNKEAFKKAVTMCSGLNKAYMISLLLAKGDGLEFVRDVEHIFIEQFTRFMDNYNISSDIYNGFSEYIEGNIAFENVEKALSTLFGKNDRYLYHLEFCKVLFWLKNVSPMFVRAVKLISTIGNPAILRNVYDEFNEFKAMEKWEDDLSSYIELLDSCGASIKDYICYLGHCAFDDYVRKTQCEQAVNILEKLIKENEDKVIENLVCCEAEARKGLLELLFNNCDETKVAKILIEYLGDSSKVVREKVVELLAMSEKSHEYVIQSLSSKKQVIRECAVKILFKSSNEQVVEALRKALEVEKNEKIKALLREALNVDSNLEENSEELNILDYCKEAIKGNKAAALKWLDCDTLPKVRFINSEKIAENEIIKYMLICYSSCIEIGISSEARKVSELLDSKDLSKFALEIFERWLNNGAESKKKWVLPFAAVYGDYDVISILKKQIEEWPKNSRGAIACEAVKALALNGSNEALIIVDNISRKFKFRQVKEAAATALKFASEQMGVDMEELSDRIVPSLGFDVRGERVFDYGDRKFTVILTPELAMDIQDEAGKKLKSLPAISKKDDEVKANEALSEFKNLKKQLKTVASIQAIRLEMALSSNRKWTKESWIKLFVENPIMHQFAIGLVWGIYEENVLTHSFRYMEDGSFNTKDEDEFELNDGMVIGIVHPIELESNDITLWKEQFENYEIKQPIEQLSREIFIVTEEEKNSKKVERFGGIMLNGLSILGKLTSFGWSRGPIGDGGGYYTFYKEDGTYKIDVELSFSGVSVGYENDEVTVYDLSFYKEGTASSYNYIHDKVREQNVVSLDTLPKRFFSEILYQVNKATISNTGTNENWKAQK